MKKDEDRAALVSVLWSFAFLIGMFISAFVSRAYGITLMIVSTVILALYLWYDGRIDHVKDRLDTYIEDCARREKEARRR